MLKNSKSINDKSKNPKNKRKKESKVHASNSVTTLKNYEISKKLTKQLKNTKKKFTEKKSLNISTKEIKNPSKEKEYNKKLIKKQSSYISKISNENLQSTIDNELNEKKSRGKKKGRYLSMRSSDIKKKKISDKKIDIENYLNELKAKKANRQAKGKINTSNTNNNNNFSIELSKNKKHSKNILNINISSFSPIEKNKNRKVYNISSKHKLKCIKNFFSQTNPNNNKNNDKNKSKNKSSKPKEEKLIKNESQNNLMMRNIIKPNNNFKPFCSMINIPINNKTKEINNNNNFSNDNYNNNFIFDKDKYFKNFKNKMNNNNILKKKLKIENSKNNYLSEENKKSKKELSPDEFILFNNINKRKKKSKKKLSYIEPTYINSIYSQHNKKQKNYIKNYNNVTTGRNVFNNNNISEPQKTECHYKNNKNKNKFSNLNIDSYTQTNNPEKKSLTITLNNNEIKHRHSIKKSGRNKKSNKTYKTQNSNNNKKNYLKIISLFDKLKKYKNNKKLRKNKLEIFFLNNSNMRTSATNTNSNNYNSNYYIENIDENKIKENLVNNTLIMYSIYILSKYNENCDLVGLTKIILFDRKGNNIPIVCYNTNYNLNNKQKIGISSLFNYTNNNIEKNSNSNNFSLYECNSKDIPLILEFKNNMYINFYVKNITTDNLEYIQINNFFDLKKNISPIKHIQIFKGNNLIYDGILNESNLVNKIFINQKININNNHRIYNSVINTNKIVNYIKQRPLSSSKMRSNFDTQNTKTSTYRKSEINNKIKLDYYKKQNDLVYYNGLYKKCNMNDIRNTKLLTGNLKQEINISNTYTMNNMTSNLYDIQKTYNTNNTNNKQNIYYISNINYDMNSTDESNKISKIYKIKEKSIINAYDTTCKKEKEEKILIKSNSEKKYKKPLIKTQKSILFQKILEENNKDNNYPKKINYFSNNNSINKNYSLNYIEFNKIRLVLTSNYGHQKYIGLTGIEFYDLKDKLINIESASSVGALPKDLRTIYNDNEELRIFENVFNNYNNTNDVDNMWVTKFNKKFPYSFIEIYFEEKIKISKIKIFNYNQKDKLQIGVKTLDIFLDDKFYKKINIRQGTGEIAYDYIKDSNKENNKDSFEYNSYDFGQSILFPILDNENIENKNIYNFFNINNKTEKIKFASNLFEQSYETPYLPYGDIFKFQFINNYYKGISIKNDLDILKYNDIGVDKIEIFDEKNNNLCLNYNEYNILANCEIVNNNENKILLNGMHNENNNNAIFYIFKKGIKISYIKLYPLNKNEKGNKINSLNSLKEIKIFCDNNIIFEGNLYLYHPTIILFTSDEKIVKNINENYLTKNVKNRECKEIFKENYISLVFH